MAIGRLSLQEKRDIIGVFKTETSFSSWGLFLLTLGKWSFGNVQKQKDAVESV